MASVSALDAVARFGFAGRGVAYLIAGLALLAEGRASDPAELLKGLGETGVGRAGLFLIALGLFGHGLLGWTSAMMGRETMAVRLSRFVSGVLHAVVALYLLFLAAGGADAVEKLFTQPGQDAGRATTLSALLALLGLWQFFVVWRASFLGHLIPAGRENSWLVRSGRVAYLARGFAFLLGSLFLWNVHVAGAAETLRAISRAELYVAALSLVAFGLFSLIEAACGRIARAAC